MKNDRTSPQQPRIRPNDAGLSTDVKRGYRTRPRGTISWDEIPQDKIGLLVHAVTAQGAAVMFGVTSDGGALSVTVLNGDERIREWPNSTEQFEDLYAWLVGMFSGD